MAAICSAAAPVRQKYEIRQVSFCDDLRIGKLREYQTALFV